MNKLIVPTSPAMEHSVRPPDGQSDALDIRQILNTLGRRRGLMLIVFAAVIVGAYVAIGQITPRYTAHASVLLQTLQANPVDLESVIGEASADDEAIQTEVDVLTSRSLARRVVERLDLMSDPEFNITLLPPQPSLGERLGLDVILPNPLRSWLFGEQEEPPQVAFEHQLTITISQVLKRLTVENDGASYTINIAFQSENPAKAATVANAFVEEYLDGQLEAKYAAAERAALWVDNKLRELRDRVRTADEAVQAFRENHGLLQIDEDRTLATEQLIDLNDQLTGARAERAAIEAQLREVQRLASNPEAALAASPVGASPLVQDLRGQENTLQSALAELRAGHGSLHPLVLNAEAQLGEVRQRMSLEVTRAIATLRSDVEVARAREAELEERLTGLMERNELDARSSIELQRLTTEADAARSLYETFVVGMDSTSVQIDILQADARVLNHAEQPLWSSYPQSTLMLGVAGVAAVMLAILAAAIAEFVDRGVRDPAQLEQRFGIPVLSLVPVAPDRRRGQRHPSSYAIRKPTSAYAEAIRSVRTMMHYSSEDDPPKVLLVTSAAPNEGKTSFASTLARLTALSGARVLLVDCDLRHPTIGRDLGIRFADGLPEVLADHVSMAEAVTVDEQTGLEVIGARTVSPLHCELLGSRRMRTFVEAARETYDLIVLDSAPVAVVSDAVTLANMADSTILVVRWGRTSMSAVQAAVRAFRGSSARISGIVLSQVNVKAHARYGLGQHPAAYARKYYAS